MENQSNQSEVKTAFIAYLEKKIAASEARRSSLEADADDPEIWQESGYYLQQHIHAEAEYCDVLYKKLHRLQETSNQ